MQSIIDFTQGLCIIEPFLKQHGFEFETLDLGRNSGGAFTMAIYKKESKKFIICYRDSIEHVVYQFFKSIVSHDFYFEQLGLADKKQFSSIRWEDKLLEFKKVLHDFEYLTDDFFDGQCDRLIEIAKLQDNVMQIPDKKKRDEFIYPLDETKIEMARQAFKKREFKKCIEIYLTIEDVNSLNELDRKIVAISERFINQ